MLQNSDFMVSLCIQAQGSLSSDELRVHLSVPSDNVVINNTNTHTYSSRYQRIHTFPDDRDREGEYQEPSTVLRPREQRDSTGDTHKTHWSIHIPLSVSAQEPASPRRMNSQNAIRKSTLGQSTIQTKSHCPIWQREEGDFISLKLHSQMFLFFFCFFSVIVAFMTNTSFFNHCVIVFIY